MPDLQYLMIDGHGDPNTPVYVDAVSALYPVAYKLKLLAALVVWAFRCSTKHLVTQA